MRVTDLPALGLWLALCCLALPAGSAAAAPAGSSIGTATQRAVAAAARHHSSPLKRYRRPR